MRLGAIHRPAPEAMRPLASLASLGAMVAPPRVDWFAELPADGDPLGNDVLGNCVECAMLQAIAVRRAAAWGDIWRPSRADAVTLYSRLAGYDPAVGRPDAGTDTVQAMAAWARHGVAAGNSVDVSLPAPVDPQDLAHVRLAIALTGPVQATFALPAMAEHLDDWLAPPGNSDAWRPASWGYHRVLIGAYEGAVLVTRSWGRDFPIGPEFWAAFCVGIDAALSREWTRFTGLSPSGLDWDDLEASRKNFAA